MTTLLKNCRLISPDLDYPGASLLLAEGRVDRIVLPGEALPAADRVIELDGKTVVPGYIDIHCHGRRRFFRRGHGVFRDDRPRQTCRRSDRFPCHHTERQS